MSDRIDYLLEQIIEVKERLARIEQQLENGPYARIRLIQWAMGLLFSINIAVIGLLIRLLVR